MYKYIKPTNYYIEYLEEEGREGSQKLIARAKCGNLEENWLEIEEVDVYKSGRGGNLKTFYRRMCRNRQ